MANGYYIAGQAGKAAWNDKAGRWLLVGLAGLLGVTLFSVVAKTAETVKTVIGVPLAFFDGLLKGWNQSEPPDNVYNNFTEKLKVINIEFSKLQFNEVTYRTIADKLFLAMEGAGTDWTLLQSSLNGLNAEDYKAVWVAFGLRVSGSGFGNTYQDLTQWLLNDLSASNYATIKTSFGASGLV